MALLVRRAHRQPGPSVSEEIFAEIAADFRRNNHGSCCSVSWQGCARIDPLQRRRRAMMARIGACMVLILLGADPVSVGEASAGTMLSNLFHENHIRRPPRSVPRLRRAARVPLPHARPERAPPAVAAKGGGQDAQTPSTSAAISPLP